MMRDAVAHGLPPDVARRAVVALLVGTGRLLEKTGEDPEATVAAFLDFRGVTAAAIQAMRAAGFDAAVSPGLAAALENPLALRACRRRPRWQRDAALQTFTDAALAAFHEVAPGAEARASLERIEKPPGREGGARAMAAPRSLCTALRLHLGRRRLPAGPDGARGRVHPRRDRGDTGGQEEELMGFHVR